MQAKQLKLLEAPDFLYTQELIAGVDEVGRGALFGPVVAAAVILPPNKLSSLIQVGVTDSKQLSSRQRQQLAGHIRTVAIACQIGLASVAEIDQLNILQASLLAMQRAILKLQVQPSLCLIDGNQKIPRLAITQQTLVKGDQNSVAIAAASIVAKVWRDQFIARLAAHYPAYDLLANKGYGTTRHRQALQRLGPSPLHRRSFAPCRVRESSTASVLEAIAPTCTQLEL
ncbi:ribonuclease HII [Trichocoleus sp. FACHB-591]|uniref:ribonuclease HII n=1 Tax=Trichocoleus sp. FACHB-591 TaxID=2692872 RepID=UPI0016847289|nr:ribonuclease HII [Trichocoleus sp. FACHB-591]MBD2096677.1 ribonuclease HII [Trichocoleus sp. FACHB-591]